MNLALSSSVPRLTETILEQPRKHYRVAEGSVGETGFCGSFSQISLCPPTFTAQHISQTIKLHHVLILHIIHGRRRKQSLSVHL